MRGASARECKTESIGVRCVKGVLVAVLTSIVGVLLFALVIKMLDLQDGMIAPVNQVIKLASMFLGAWVAVGPSRDKGFLKGLIVGGAYMLLGTVVFSVMEARISPPAVICADTAMGGIAGMLSGMIAANVRRR